MFSVIEQHVKENKIVPALEECVKNRQFFLGLFIGRLRPETSSKYNDLMREIETATGNKEKNPPTTRVLLLCNWLPSDQIVSLWSKMSQGGGRWNAILIVDKEPADYYVVINAPPANSTFDTQKTILFRMEPNMSQNPQIWGSWANPDPSKFLRILSPEKGYHNNVEWHLSRTYTELKNTEIKKNKILSTVLSEKYQDPGQIKRIDFVKFLEKNGVGIDVYGSNRWEYKNYQGSLPYHNKDNAILPYKYTFNVENCSLKNYFTEKLVDGILGECLVFYSGCFNVREYFDERAFVYLELSNFEEDCKTVRKAIEEDWHSKRLPYILEAKRKILEEYQFFPRLEAILKEDRKGK